MSPIPTPREGRRGYVGGRLRGDLRDLDLDLTWTRPQVPGTGRAKFSAFPLTSLSYLARGWRDGSVLPGQGQRPDIPVEAVDRQVGVGDRALVLGGQRERTWGCGRAADRRRSEIPC